MENIQSNVIEKLRQLSLQRSKFIEFLQNKLISASLFQLLESSVAFHAITMCTTIAIISFLFATIRNITLFSMHPLLMSIGTLMCLCQGMVAFRNRFLVETLSPIMQHTKRMKNRAIHQSMQIMGASFLAMGLLFIVANKIEHSHTLMPLSIHSLLGCCALSLLVVQAVSGQQKIEEFQRSNSPRKILRWHGDTGLLLWDSLCLTLLTGVIEFFSLFSVASFLLTLGIVASWLTAHTQMRKKMPDILQDSYGGGGGGSGGDWVEGDLLGGGGGGGIIDDEPSDEM